MPAMCGYKGQYYEYANKISTSQLDELANSYIKKLNTFSESALRITDKMPQNFLYAGLIAQLFPQARIIHCSRNPLDTILSIYFQYFSKSHNYSFKLENIAHYYLEYQRLMEHWKNVLNIPLMELPFEETCHEMVAFTGLEWDQQCVNFHQSKRTVVTASFDQVRSPIYKSSIDRWKYYEKFLAPLKPYFPDLLN